MEHIGGEKKFNILLHLPMTYAFFDQHYKNQNEGRLGTKAMKLPRYE